MALPFAALIAALGPALKKILASEAINVARKYLFDRRTKAGRELNEQLYQKVSESLNGMQESDWNELLNKFKPENIYRKKAGEWISELVPNAAGTVVSTAGQYKGLRDSILADMVSNAVSGLVSPRVAKEWGNPYQMGGNLLAAGTAGRGALAQVITDAAGGWLANLSQQVANENLQNRISRMMLDNSMTGQALQTLRWSNDRTQMYKP